MCTFTKKENITMIGIIGGGIFGLTLAYELQKKQIPYILLEASHHVGGAIRSERKDDGTLLEHGPNSLLCNNEVKDFIDELGLTDELVISNDVSKNRFIIKNKKLTKVPQHPIKLIFSNFFSFKTKLKIVQELRAKYHKSDDLKKENLHDFFERHFGKEVVEYLVNPFISGIYAGSPKELITSIAFPTLVEYEEKYGSILKGFSKNKSLERKQIVSFKEGLQTIPNQLAKKIEHLRTNSAVHSIQKTENQYILTYGNEQKVRVNKIVLACPPPISSTLVKELHPEISNLLQKVNMPPMRIVHSIFKKEDVGELNGFGVLHPKVENLQSAGSIWNSSVFKDRTKDNQFLITSFVGGSQYEEQTKISEKETFEKVSTELQKYYGIKNSPIQQYSTFYEYSIPQYNQTIQLILEKRKHLENENIYFGSNLLDGISLPDCIKNAKKLVEILNND